MAENFIKLMTNNKPQIYEVHKTLSMINTEKNSRHILFKVKKTKYKVLKAVGMCGETL